MASKSCFGCGEDWTARWSQDDLAPMLIAGEERHVCPDCVEEVTEQYLAAPAAEEKKNQDAALWDVSPEEKALIEASGFCRECGMYRRQYDGTMEDFREPDLCECCARYNENKNK